MVCRITKIDLTSQGKKWKWLWLMYVNGVDLNFHCQRCLLGWKSQKMRSVLIKGNGENIILNESRAKYYYLCGGSDPYRWKDNFHLAWEEKEGEILKVNEQGVEVEIENAIRVNFSEEDIDYSLKNASKKNFNTCRNWQFANKINNTKSNINSYQSKLF